MEETELLSPSTSTSGVQAANTGLQQHCSIHVTYEDMDTTPAEEAQVPKSSPCIEPNPLEGWTKAEKFALYLGIKYKGSKNVKEIQANIPTKTTAQIIDAISYYKEKAQQTQECAAKRMKLNNKKIKKSAIPLASWAKQMTDNFSFEELQTEMVSALRLIAEFDDIPPAKFTEGINFRQAYHIIADAMEGKSLTGIPNVSDFNLEHLLKSCLFETALISKSIMSTGTLRNIVNSINLNIQVSNFPHPTSSHEETIMRQLVSQTNYNPLGISHSHILTYMLPK